MAAQISDPVLREKYEKLTEAYNNLSDSFIKFSLAYDQAQRALEAHDQPVLDLKIS